MQEIVTIIVLVVVVGAVLFMIQNIIKKNLLPKLCKHPHVYSKVHDKNGLEVEETRCQTCDMLIVTKYFLKLNFYAVKRLLPMHEIQWVEKSNSASYNFLTVFIGKVGYRFRSRRSIAGINTNINKQFYADKKFKELKEQIVLNKKLNFKPLTVVNIIRHVDKMENLESVIDINELDRVADGINLYDKDFLTFGGSMINQFYLLLFIGNNTHVYMTRDKALRDTIYNKLHFEVGRRQ